MKKVYGYCRCSTDENKQDISRQVRELKEMGAVSETIFTEYISGMKENKVELQKLLNVIRSGDTLAVTELSRLTRSTKQLCDIIETVKNKQIKLIIKDSITIDCTNGTLDPMTAAFLQITGVFAELERNMISERTKSGLRNAKAKGKRIGRPPTNVDDLPDFFYRDYEYLMHGISSKTDTAKYLNISRPTLNKYIRLYSVIYDYAAEYNERFGHIFPIARLKMDYKYSEILNIAVKCLEQGKNIYAIGVLK